MLIVVVGLWSNLVLWRCNREPTLSTESKRLWRDDGAGKFLENLSHPAAAVKRSEGLNNHIILFKTLRQAAVDGINNACDEPETWTFVTRTLRRVSSSDRGLCSRWLSREKNSTENLRLRRTVNWYAYNTGYDVYPYGYYCADVRTAVRSDSLRLGPVKITLYRAGMTSHRCCRTLRPKRIIVVTGNMFLFEQSTRRMGTLCIPIYCFGSTNCVRVLKGYPFRRTMVRRRLEYRRLRRFKPMLHNLSNSSIIFTTVRPFIGFTLCPKE